MKKNKLQVLDLLENEEVKEILGYPNYLVSNIGRVFVFRKTTGYKQVKPDNSREYTRVEMWRQGSPKKESIHRLVASAFLHKVTEDLAVNHKDGDKRNNKVENLEWVTRSENQKHAYRIGLQIGFKAGGIPLSESHKKALCGSRWKKEKHPVTIDGVVFKDLKEAGLAMGVSRQTVLNRCRSAKWPSWQKEVIYDAK
jgi:hypothetical protein